LTVLQEKQGGYNEWNPVVATLYLYAYLFTGKKKYLKAVEEGVAKNNETRPQLRIFQIYLLSLLYHITENPIYKNQLNSLIDNIRKFQLPNGAVRTFFHDEKKTRELYGLSEVDVIHKDSEPIVDQLYVNSLLALCLYMAYKTTGDKAHKNFFHRVMDFLAAIQIKSKDKRLNGAWMRAYDYEYQDY
jgi:hypothetical protein